MADLDATDALDFKAGLSTDLDAAEAADEATEESEDELERAAELAAASADEADELIVRMQFMVPRGK